MGKNRGFSVIELLVTIIIFAVTMSVVLGLGGGKMSRTGLKSSANDVIGMIYKIRMRAAKENRAIALTFTDNGYKEHFSESGVWSPLLTSSSDPDDTLTTGTSFSSYSTIAFNSRGILIDPNTFMIKANITLTLQSDKGEGIKIKVLSYGGVKSKNSWRNWSEYGGF